MMRNEYTSLDGRYRVKHVYDPADMDYDRYYLQKRFLLLFWRTVDEAYSRDSINEAYDITLYLESINGKDR